MPTTATIAAGLANSFCLTRRVAGVSANFTAAGPLPVR
jgi:hypothetical protein